MDGDIDRARKQRVFQFLDENSLGAAFCADLCHGRGLQLVAGRVDADQLGFNAVPPRKFVTNVIRLP